MSVPSTNNNKETQTRGNLSNSQQHINSSMQGGQQIQVVNLTDVPKQLMSSKKEKWVSSTGKNLPTRHLVMLSNALKNAEDICTDNVAVLDDLAEQTKQRAQELEEAYKTKALESKVKRVGAAISNKESEGCHSLGVALAPTHPEQSFKYLRASGAYEARAQDLEVESQICTKESQTYLREANFLNEEAENVLKLAEEFDNRRLFAAEWGDYVDRQFKDLECTSTPRPFFPKSKAKKPIKVSITPPLSHSISALNSEPKKQTDSN